jgi:hypothetical protein
MKLVLIWIFLLISKLSVTLAELNVYLGPVTFLSSSALGLKWSIKVFRNLLPVIEIMSKFNDALRT